MRAAGGALVAAACMAPAPGAAQQRAADTATASDSAADARALRDSAAAAPFRDAATSSEEENYLRVLQLAGVVPLRPWSIRPFAPGELAALAPRDTTHPWARRRAPSAWRAGGLRVHLLPPAVDLTVNSATPFAINDGAVWAGRGLTAAARGGVAFRQGPLSVRLEPVVFWAGNAGFPLKANGQLGDARFADGIEPGSVDLPQRFGDAAYARIDPGQSTIRLDAFGMTVGASTANEHWGPALIDPLVLGTNAPGIPRVFVGTSRPANLGLGTLHVRLEAGRLDETEYSPMPSDSSLRVMSGIALVTTIRGVPGLEIGGARFFHRPWGSRGFTAEALTVPFENFLKEALPDKDSPGATPDNQIASLFARWAFPAAGLEAYGEYARNDHNQNARDLTLEPDQNAAYMFGARHVWRRGADRVRAVRVEFLNARVSHLQRVRNQSRFYQHADLRQGHTQRGQLLGSAAGLGGGAGTFGFDEYRPDGRWTFEIARRVRHQGLGEGAPRRMWDVFNIARAERLRFTDRGDVVIGVAGLAQLNRNFVDDSYGVRVDLGWRFGGGSGRARQAAGALGPADSASSSSTSASDSRQSGSRTP